MNLLLNRLLNTEFMQFEFKEQLAFTFHNEIINKEEEYIKKIYGKLPQKLGLNEEHIRDITDTFLISTVLPSFVDIIYKLGIDTQTTMAEVEEMTRGVWEHGIPSHKERWTEEDFKRHWDKIKGIV